MLVGTASRIVVLLVALPAAATAQLADPPPLLPGEVLGEVKLFDESLPPEPEDTLSSRVRAEAHAADGSRILISLRERLLLWMDGTDTLRIAPIAIGKGSRLHHEDQVWDFSTPRGVRRVVSKQENPAWVPPDWHYVELARDSGLVLLQLPADTGALLLDGSRLVVRGDRIGRAYPDGRFELLPADQEVAFGDTLFIPPHGTANRRIEGELGAYKLDLGDGYMIHGTPHKTSIGNASTHGCIRMRDGDLEFLYYRVPVGTAVYIY
ncbi:MAG TPA: L,D-transpeptidase [Longimicrobiaceae bacterium]